MASGKTMKTTITLYGKQDASLKRAFQAAQSGGAQAADKLSGVFKKAAAAASAAFAAIKVGDFMKDAMDTYATFEQSMANTAAIAGASADDYEMMAKAARDAGKATAFEASEAADALGYMALAGWDAQTSTKALMPVLKLAEATQMDLANTSDLVTDSMSAMGLEVEDLNDYLDVLITTNNKANTTAGALMEAMIGAGGATRAAGIDVRDTATALGILANNGKKGSEAGTALNSIIARMTTNDKALTAAEKLNVKIFDEETGKFRGLETVLKDVNAAFANLTQEDRLFYQKALGGTNYFSQLGYLLDGVKDRYYDFSQAQDMLADKGKNVSKIFTEVPDIFGNLSDAAKDALNELGAVYKYEDDDALLDTNFILEQLADSLYNYSDAEREAYLKTIAGEGRWQDLNDVLVTMYDTLDENSSAWSKLHGELDEAGGSLDEMWKTATDTLTYAKSVWNSAVSDFKIGLAEAFGPKLKNILNKASARFPQITENLSGMIEKIPFDRWADKIGGMVDATFDFFGSITEGKGVFESLGDAIAGAMASGADGQMFGNWELRQKIQDVKDFAASIDENIGKSWDRIKGIGVWLKDEFLQAVNTVRESFEKHGPSLEKLKKLGENIKKVADDMFGGAQKTVEDLNDSSLPTLTDMLATIADKAVDVANAFLEWEGAVPTITTIVTAIVSLKVITTIVAGVKSAAAAFGAFKAVVTGWNLAGQLAGISTWAKGFATQFSQAMTTAGGALSSFGSKAATALSGAASSVGSFMTADMGASLAAGGATAGATIATALVGSIVAALGGLEVGKKIGAMIFPDDADIYESYSGLSGTWQLLKDTAQAAWDGIVMLVEAAGRSLKATWEDVKTAAGIIWDAIGSVIQAGIDKIMSVVDGLIQLFENLIDFIKNVFTGNWKAAWENVVKIFDTVFSTIKGIVNKIIGGVVKVINGVISGINAAGSLAGFEPIKEITFTAMARGATVTRPTYALIGEAGYPETVVPHTNTARSRALLSEATAGVYGGQRSVGNNISVTYAPVINGASGDVGAQLKSNFNEFKAYFDRLMEEKGREAFA